MAKPLTVREYVPGTHTLVYMPINPLAEVTSQCFHPDQTYMKNVWDRLGSEPVFTLEVEFTLLGDWLFVIKEDGELTSVLKARITP